MKKNHLDLLIIGIFFTLFIAAGIAVLLAPKAVSITLGIIIICLSLAAGLLFPSPASFWTLIMGICMIVFHPAVGAAILILLSIFGDIANMFIWLDRKKRA